MRTRTIVVLAIVSLFIGLGIFMSQYRVVSRSAVVINWTPIESRANDGWNITRARGFVYKETLTNSHRGGVVGYIVPGVGIFFWVILGWFPGVALFWILGWVYPRRNFTIERGGFPYRFAIYILGIIFLIVGHLINFVPRTHEIYTKSSDDVEKIVSRYGKLQMKVIRTKEAKGYVVEAWRLYNRHSDDHEFSFHSWDDYYFPRNNEMYQRLSRKAFLRDPSLINEAQFHPIRGRSWGDSVNEAHYLRAALSNEPEFPGWYQTYRWPYLKIRLAKAEHLASFVQISTDRLERGERIFDVQEMIKRDLFSSLKSSSVVWKEMRAIRRSYILSRLRAGNVYEAVMETEEEGHVDKEAYEIVEKIFLRWINSPNLSNEEDFVKIYFIYLPQKNALEFPAYDAAVRIALVEALANFQDRWNFGDPKETLKMANQFAKEYWGFSILLGSTGRSPFIFRLGWIFADEPEDYSHKAKVDERYSKFRDKVFNELGGYNYSDEEVEKVASWTFEECMEYAKKKGIEIPPELMGNKI